MKVYNVNYEQLENGNSKLVSGKQHGYLLDNIIRIYNSLSTSRKLTFNSKNYCFELYSNELNINPYNIKDGSDGERAILEIIAYTLLCERDSYLLIDEPENHLNSALLIELFNILEKERSDLIFIYFSHNIEFIESRNNVKFIHLENFDGHNWNAKEIEHFEEIPIDLIIKIAGSKKDVLFVEGQVKNLDYRLYSLLYPDKNVIPVESCDNVISRCKILSKTKDYYPKTEGIIDYDFRTEDEISSLDQSNIHVLRYNEIENVLISSQMINLVFNSTIALNGKEEDFKNSIIDKLASEKSAVLQDYIRKFYNNRFGLPKLKYYSDHSKISKQITDNANSNISDLLTSLKIFEKEFDEILKKKDYDEIIKRYPNKGLISVIERFGVTPNFYYETIFALLKNNSEQCEIIKSNLF